MPYRKKKINKERFRKDLGNIIQTYQEIAESFWFIKEQKTLA